MHALIFGTADHLVRPWNLSKRVQEEKRRLLAALLEGIEDGTVVLFHRERANVEN